jgi:aryl-alcohol dehydrogenase-like predicted oxidoreductase
MRRRLTAGLCYSIRPQREVTGLETRQLGNTGVDVSALGLGCMGLVGWYGERDDDEARATVHRAIDLGITHLDTAAVYQDGDNERFVGECIRGRRDEVFLATKCGLSRDESGRMVADNRPDTVRRSCDESLARLGVERIDLFYLHRYDRDVPLDESIGALADLVAAGKVRFVGMSEVGPETLRRAYEIYPISALQSEMSLWSCSSARPSLDLCRELGISFVAYSPLGRGFLTGALKDAAQLVEGDTRHMFPRFSDENIAANQEIVARLARLARNFDCSPAQLALAWVLAQWRGVLPIPGTKHRAYLEENYGALNLELSSHDVQAISAELPEELVQGERYPAAMLGMLDS